MTDADREEVQRMIEAGAAHAVSIAVRVAMAYINGKERLQNFGQQLSLAEAAKALGVPAAELRRAVRAGKLTVEGAGKAALLSKAEILNFYMVREAESR